MTLRLGTGLTPEPTSSFQTTVNGPLRLGVKGRELAEVEQETVGIHFVTLKRVDLKLRDFKVHIRDFKEKKV